MVSQPRDHDIVRQVKPSNFVSAQEMTRVRHCLALTAWAQVTADQFPCLFAAIHSPGGRYVQFRHLGLRCVRAPNYVERCITVMRIWPCTCTWPKSEPEVNSRDVITRTSGTNCVDLRDYKGRGNSSHRSGVARNLRDGVRNCVLFSI